MPSAPAIGACDKRCFLWEQRSRLRGEHNQPEDRWIQVCELWCAIEPLAGREFFQAGQMAATVSHRIRCRYRPGVNSRQQLRWKDKTFHLTSVLNLDERNEWLEMMATEHVGQATNG